MQTLNLEGVFQLVKKKSKNRKKTTPQLLKNLIYLVK